MILGFDIAPRAALAAPTEPFIIQAQSVVILAVSILSVIGGGWMVASFFVSPTGMAQVSGRRAKPHVAWTDRPNIETRTRSSPTFEASVTS
jgi:hypothetical protein